MPLEAVLTRARWRLRIRGGLRGLAVGLLAGSVITTVARLAGVRDGWGRTLVGILMAAAVGLVCGVWASRSSRRRAALAIDRSDPSLRNLLVTADWFRAALRLDHHELLREVPELPLLVGRPRDARPETLKRREVTVHQELRQLHAAERCFGRQSKCEVDD